MHIFITGKALFMDELTIYLVSSMKKRKQHSSTALSHLHCN